MQIRIGRRGAPVLGAMLMAAAGVWAQSLQIAPSEAAPGARASFRVVLTSPAGKEPVALQWNLRVPESLRIVAGDVVAASAAESSQKSITCAAVVVKRTAQESRAAEKDAVFTCIVAGGQNRIGNGVVAVVPYSIPAAAPRGTLTVHLEKALGVTLDLKQVDMPNAEGAITVK